MPTVIAPPHAPHSCRICGHDIKNDQTYCIGCAIEGASERMTNAAEIGRPTSHSAAAEAKLGATPTVEQAYPDVVAAVQWARELRPPAFYVRPSDALHLAETARREGGGSHHFLEAVRGIEQSRAVGEHELRVLVGQDPEALQVVHVVGVRSGFRAC